MAGPIAAAPAVGSAFRAAVSAAQKYGPQAVQAVNEQLKKATAGRASLDGVVKYVGNDPSRAMVAASAMVRGGLSIDDVIPADLSGSDAALAQIREAVLRSVSSMQNKYGAGSDMTLGQSADDAARDILRRKRVQAALQVYGSEERYFLCHPNGGIPQSDFAWYDALFRSR